VLLGKAIADLRLNARPLSGLCTNDREEIVAASKFKYLREIRRVFSLNEAVSRVKIAPILSSSKNDLMRQREPANAKG